MTWTKDEDGATEGTFQLSRALMDFRVALETDVVLALDTLKEAVVAERIVADIALAVVLGQVQPILMDSVLVVSNKLVRGTVTDSTETSMHSFFSKWIWC